MRDIPPLTDLAQRIAALFPAAGTLQEEMRTKIEQTLQKGFADLNLLTRDEFVAQSQALERAQLRVSELEGRLGALEQRLETLAGDATADKLQS